MGIAISEPKVLIMLDQVTSELSGQHVTSVGWISCMNQRNVGALDLSLIEFQRSNIVEIVVQRDQSDVSRKRLIGILVAWQKMEALSRRMAKPL